MGTSKFFTIGVLFFSVVAHADITEKDRYNKLPRGSTVTTKAGELSLSPGATSMPLGRFESDADGDGIVDYRDWCLETPKGALVWKDKDVTDKKCEPQNVGCSGAVTEKWIYDSAKLTKTPNGRSWSCSLLAIPSADDRRLPAKVLLTVIDPRDAKVTDEERAKLATTVSGNESHPITYQNLLVSTAGGTHFGLHCRALSRYMVLSTLSKPPTYYVTSSGSYSEPTVEEMKKFVDVTIAKPVPIP